MEIISKSFADTTVAAERFISFLAAHKEANRATIVGLEGDLGSGKTTFSQSIANILGVEEQVTSPTFVIEKVYHTKHTAFTQFIHIDAYRLESGHELNVLNFQTIAKDPNNLIFIEWPEKVADILPQNIFKIQFKFIDESTRTISYDTK